jgi:hypothetical protein
MFFLRNKTTHTNIAQGCREEAQPAKANVWKSLNAFMQSKREQPETHA